MVALTTHVVTAIVWMPSSLRRDILAIAVLATRMLTELVLIPQAVTAMLARAWMAELLQATARTLRLPARATAASAPPVTTSIVAPVYSRIAALPLCLPATFLPAEPPPTARAACLPVLRATPALRLRWFATPTIAKLPEAEGSGLLFLAVRFKAVLPLRPKLATPLGLELRLTAPPAVRHVLPAIPVLLLRSRAKTPCHGPPLLAAPFAIVAPLRL